MNKNPYLNAVLAAIYIASLVSIVNRFSKFEGLEETIFMPMAVLSVFVFSAAVMGLLFVYQPAALFLDNKRKEAITFFSKTLITFAGFILIFVFLIIQFGR